MIYTWIIDNKLAVSPLPSFRDIDELVKTFNAVVVLIESWEMPFKNPDLYLNKWLSRGVEVYYAPTPDYYPVDLLELYCISKWIDKQLEKGSRVLIHCKGGIGRSGMVSASYLIYKNWDLYEAIKYIRSYKPGAVETTSQHRVLEDYYILLKSVDKELFSKYISFILEKIDKITWRHLSKTIQLLIELLDHLNLGTRDSVIYATLFHCFSKNYLDQLLSNNILDKELVDLLENNSLESFFIKLAHTLDYYRDSRVVYTDSYRSGTRTIIELYCDKECSSILNKANEYIDIISKEYNLEIDLLEQQYS